MLVARPFNTCALALLAGWFAFQSIDTVATHADASEPSAVRVRVTSGREFRGVPDGRSDERRLWLRWEDTGILVLRPIDWTSIAQVARGGEVLDKKELQTELARRAPESATEDHTHVTSARLDGLRIPPNRFEHERSKSTIRAVEFYARAANWDADIAIDGLLLNVFPIDENGDLQPADGTLEVDLIGLRAIDFAGQSNSGGVRVERLGHWTYQLSRDDFGARGLVVKLPFQGSSPESDRRISPSGVVNIRLSVPGLGILESSQDGVRLRPYTPLRDALERQQYRRS